MGYERIKPEHTGAKNGGGAWMARAEAKKTAKRRRRQEGKQETEGERTRREDAEEELARLKLASSGEPLADGIQRGLLFRIQALRGELETRRENTSLYTTLSQGRALANLAGDIRKHLGPSTTLDDLVDEWKVPDSDAGVDDAITALGQLEGMVISGGLRSLPNQRAN